MKRVISIIAGFLILLASPALATWTITPSVVWTAGHYVKWKVVLTGDNSGLSATDILAQFSSNRDLNKVQGETLMAMKVVPGTGGVAPDNTLNITLSDDEGNTLWADTGIAYLSDTDWQVTSSDIGIFIPVGTVLYLTMNDIGGDGDQVTLYFITWREEI